MVHAASRVPSTVAGFYRRMAGGVGLSAIAAAAVAWWHPAAWPVALPIVVVWGFAPAIARRVSRPGTAPCTAPLSADEARALRLIARRTWEYFATFVTAESRVAAAGQFPGDAAPGGRRADVAHQHRAVPALGGGGPGFWVGGDARRGGSDRSDAAHGEWSWSIIAGISTIGTTPGTVGPLEPRYVSSVDSGNLAGALLTLANACREMIEQAAPGPPALSGIADAALLLQRSGARHRERPDRRGGRAATTTRMRWTWC